MCILKIENKQQVVKLKLKHFAEIVIKKPRGYLWSFEEASRLRRIKEFCRGVATLTNLDSTFQSEVQQYLICNLKSGFIKRDDIFEFHLHW